MIEAFTTFMLNDGLNQNKDLIIFDIGSRDCGQAIEFYNMFPNAKIYAFECNPNTIPLCQKNIQEYSDRITLIPKAINSYTGNCTFYPIDQTKTLTSWKDGNPGASSLFVANGKYAYERYVQYTTTVDCVTLSDVMQEYGIPKVDIIWMDLQGAELIALESLGEHIKTLKYIHTELSFKAIYTGQAMFRDVHLYLVENGLALVNDKLQTNEWQDDGIYKNTTLQL